MLYKILLSYVYISEMNLKKTKPQRYVYHVTYEYYRTSISKKIRVWGNHPNLSEAIFAYNRPIPHIDCFPYVLDSWDWTDKNNYNLEVESNYNYLKYQNITKGYRV